MSLLRGKNTTKDSFSLSLGNVTGDFLKSRGATLYAGCCCCCCCFFWVGGLIGTAVGAVTGVRAKSVVKGSDYGFLIALFWISFVAFLILSSIPALAEENFIIVVAGGAPALHVLLAFILVLIVGQIRLRPSEQRRSAYLVCLKIFVGTLVGYGLGWLAIPILFS